MPDFDRKLIAAHDFTTTCLCYCALSTGGLRFGYFLRLVPLLPQKLSLFSGPLLLKLINLLLNVLQSQHGFVEVRFNLAEISLRFDRLHLEFIFALLCLLYEPLDVFPLASLFVVESVAFLSQLGLVIVQLYVLPVEVRCFIHAHLQRRERRHYVLLAGDYFFDHGILIQTHHELPIAQAADTTFLRLFIADDPQLGRVRSQQFCAEFIAAPLATESAPDDRHVSEPATRTLNLRLFGFLTPREKRLLSLENWVLLFEWNQTTVYLYLSRFSKDLVKFLFMFSAETLQVLIRDLRQSRLLIVHLLELLQVGRHILGSHHARPCAQC